MALPFDIDPTEVGRAGWAVVFSADTPSEVRYALEPFVMHRQEQVPKDRFRILEYLPGETLNGWLKRHGVYPGGISPTKVPYYLLLVGQPTAIPFEFQSLLDIEYAVGRLAFDQPESYRRYAESLLAYESAPALPQAREVVYWAPRHAHDPVTQRLSEYVINPMTGTMVDTPGVPESAVAERFSFQSRLLTKQLATKHNLAGVLHARDVAPPAVLFATAHGLGWPKGHDKQEAAQGALLCQDWEGPGTIQPEQYFAAADVANDARVHGLVAFLLASYAAGTPKLDSFLDHRGERPQIAERPFVAALAQRLLAHPQGGALAILGLAERAWGYSVPPPNGTAGRNAVDVLPFRNWVGRVLSGQPVGHATKDISERYASLATDFLSQLDEEKETLRTADMKLAWTWAEQNAAQNYILLGDPAARLRLDLGK